MVEWFLRYSRQASEVKGKGKWNGDVLKVRGREAGISLSQIYP
jgi:hypothetical protein